MQKKSNDETKWKHIYNETVNYNTIAKVKVYKSINNYYKINKIIHDHWLFWNEYL